MRRRAVREHPDIGRDTGVVEHIERQRDDRFEPVPLDGRAADVALARADITGEERRAVVELREAAAEPGVLLHLAAQFRQEQHPAIARAGDERVLRVAGMRDDEPRVLAAVLPAHAREVAHAAPAIKRIEEHGIELARRERISGEGRVLRAADDGVRCVPRP